jgi:2-amino-4-hydroxy-6-hydroxymethyldihydropteridine diphosphokinase
MPENSPEREYVLLSIGSNVGDKQASINLAIQLLVESGALENHCVSSYYETEPFGENDQNWFLNIAVSGYTKHTVFALLQICKSIEYLMDRRNRGRWKEREIDIDIILFGNSVIEKQMIKVPHIGMKNRKFVLIPAVEIAAYAKDPKTCKTLAELLEECEDASIVKRLNSN